MERGLRGELVSEPKVIRQKDDGWYFIDETWSDECGPYKTERKAKRKLKKYVKFLNTKRRS